MSIKKIVAEKAKNYPPHSQNHKEMKDVVVVAKLFNFCGGWTWYITEYDPKTALAYWYVEWLVNDPLCDEWGYFNIDELANIKSPFNTPMIEVDEWFTPKTLWEITFRSAT